MDKIWERKWTFLGTFFLVFVLSYLVLVAIDFVPESPDAVTDDATEEEAELEETANEEFEFPVGSVNEPILPQALYIEKLDRRVSVLNPESRTIADLDEALLSGAVRHPDSADLSQDSNVFILGHSSHLPTVINKNFQAFNDIETLEWGDTIELISDSYIITYEVEKVYKAKASDVTVPIAGTGPRLTLATCNSFGSTDDRFIVEAKRVEVRQL
ncbi:MAG TPA: sortase [Candidatus Paceibacterota bacterium]